jgi:hypothetical protein
MAQRQNAGRSMLALDGLTCRFGETVAVQSVSLEFEQGAFVGIIGVRVRVSRRCSGRSIASSTPPQGALPIAALMSRRCAARTSEPGGRARR